MTDSQARTPLDPLERALLRCGFAKGDHVGVAVSGGPDSTSALAATAALGCRVGFTVTAIHVDHGLRGPAAAFADERAVARCCEILGVDFLVRKADVLTRDRGGSRSIEFAAREARYAVFREVAATVRITHLVLGHHRDDQDEHVILALLRGSWPQALAGMPPARDLIPGCTLVRPFLDLRKSELGARLGDLPISEDESNAAPAHRRNVVRLALLPALQKTSDATATVLARVRRQSSALTEACAARVNAVRPRLLIHREPGLIVLDARTLTQEARLARAWILRALCNEDRTIVGPASWQLVRQLEDALGGTDTAAWEIKRGVWIERRDGRIHVFRDPPATDPGPPVAAGESEWVLFDDGVRRISLRAESRDGDGRCPNVAVRRARPSDRFPLENGGTQSLADLLSNRHVPRAFRRRVPVLIADGRIAWVVGVRSAAVPSTPGMRWTAWVDGSVPWARTEGPHPAPMTVQVTCRR